MPAIVVDNLTKTFRTGGVEVIAVDRVSLQIEEGMTVAFTGPSGSGKSTLLHLIGAVERPDSGTIRVGDTEVALLRRDKLAAYRRGIGFVFQRYHLLPALTALENVMAPVLPYRVRYNKAARARELLAAVGLEGRERSLPAELSGGQQQRVAIARALMSRPALLLADEPTGNLDSVTGAGILDLLADLRREYSMTTLVATHEQHVATRASRLIRLRDGAVIDDLDLHGGTPEATLDRASCPRA
ncbi:MAG TPA: ABC transporter ATP-binding protein [Micromonosporaceae bacterium]|jgi:putative ABC transport system ATP-binding protein